MPEREIVYGPDVATADFATRVDTNDNNRAKLLETADGTTVLLEWDGAASEWVYGGAVNMGGNDITNVGAITSTSLSTVTGSVDGDEMVGFPDTSTDVSGTVAIGTGWNVIDSNRPTFLVVRLRSVTDGTTRGDLRLEIDESGGTTVDYIAERAFAVPGLGSGVLIDSESLVHVPAGASVQINNVDDPNGLNEVNTARKFTL